MEESTFACQLTSPELQKRKASIIRELKGIIHSKKELDSGYSYTFSNSNAVLDLIFDFVKSERLCCLFFNFQINVNPNSYRKTRGEGILSD